MQSSALPSRIPKKWAAAASGTYVRDIPEASQIGTTPGAASFTDGFVPLNATPVASGGIPPDVRDMNGILRAVTQGLQWVQAGGFAAYDSTFNTAISGYPLGALLAHSTYDGTYWLNGAENNTTNPESGGTNWTRLQLNVTSRFPATAPTNGQTLIGKTDGSFAVANITAGANTTVTNADGSITIGGNINAVAWVSFVGTGVVSIRAAANVSSITDNGTGNYTVNFTNALVDTNYCVAGAVRGGGTDGDAGAYVVRLASGGLSTSGVQILSTATNYGASMLNDAPIVNLMVMR